MLTTRQAYTTRSVFVIIGALAIITGVFAVVGPYARLEGALLVLIGTVMAVVPGLLWLLAFYVQDRLEPEPRIYVVEIFVLGALLAAAVGQPLLRDVFRVQDWIWNDFASRVLGSILVVGVVQAFLTYAAVRYTIYRSAEFDEPMDGIVYGAAAGLGYATLLNVDYVVANGGVHLGVGAFHVAIAALGYGSFGAIIGFFLARAKFARVSPLALPAALLLGATLNGVVAAGLPDVAGGTSAISWFGLIAASVLAFATFAVLLRLIRTTEPTEVNELTLVTAGGAR